MGTVRDGAERARLGGLRRGPAVATLSLAGCALLPSPTPGPVPVRPVGEAGLGPVDRAVAAVDAQRILKSVEGGAACREGSFAGGRGGGDGWHSLRDFVCPRNGDDRTVYFLFADAFKAAVLATGATSDGEGAESGAASQPIVTDWALRGDRSVGTARLLGVNGPGTLTLYLSVDLVVP